MASTTFTIEGEVNVDVTVTEMADGTLKFELNVVDPNPDDGINMTADLGGLFFDMSKPASEYGELTVINSDEVTGSIFNEDRVTKVENWNNVNGEVAAEAGKFDAGVQFGTSGMALDDYQSATFYLDSDTIDLSLDDISLEYFGVRLTSVGEEGGERDGSLKLLGQAPEAAQGPVNIAEDDFVFATEDSEFAIVDGLDEIVNLFESSVTSNDTTDGGAYTGTLYDDAGNEILDVAVLEGSNGGTLLLYSDGSIDFSANGTDGVNDFEYLETGAIDTTETTFTYAVEGGDTATITVNVVASTGDNGDGTGTGGTGEGGGGTGDGGGGLPPIDDGGLWGLG